jgi:hypothetical protein
MFPTMSTHSLQFSDCYRWLKGRTRTPTFTLIQIIINAATKSPQITQADQWERAERKGEILSGRKLLPLIDL